MNQLPQNQPSRELPNETSSILSLGDGSSELPRAIILVLQRVMPHGASIAGIDLNPARKVEKDLGSTYNTLGFRTVNYISLLMQS